MSITSDAAAALANGVNAGKAALAAVFAAINTALSGKAAAGSNSDITSLNGLSTAIQVSQGGTGASTQAVARSNLGAAKSGVNSDITQLTGLTTALPINEGGTGQITAPLALAALGGALAGAFAASGITLAASDVITALGLTPGPPPPGFISGLALSRPSTTSFGVAAGSAVNEDGGTPYVMTLASAITKTTATWVAGTGNGGIDTGAVAANTTYFVHLIRKTSDGSLDALYSLSPTGPTMPTGYVARRRIGTLLTNGSSQFILFQQTGDLFVFDVPVSDVAATNPGTSAVTATLSVPIGIVVRPVVSVGVKNATTASISLLVTPLSITDTTPTLALSQITTNGTFTTGKTSVGLRDVPTNTSGQIRYRLSASGAADIAYITTHGWIDQRGAT